MRVVATAKLEVRGSLTEGGTLQVRGKLVDDAGTGLPGTGVFLSLAKPEAAEVPLPLPPPSPPIRANAVGTEWIFTTSTDGSFSIDVPVEPLPHVIVLRSEKTSWIGAASARVQVEPGRKPVELAFPSPPDPPATIDLDAESLRFKIRVTSEGVEKDGVEVTLADSRAPATVIARSTSARGQATFELPTSALGPPGTGELVASFAGAPGFSAATARIFTRRTALAIFRDAHQVDPNGSVPVDGLAIAGEIRSKAGAGANGVVEALLGGVRVGIGQVEDGAFRVVARWRAEQEGIATVTLRFVPAGEGWSGRDLELPVRVRVAGPWRSVAAAVAGAVLIALLLRSRRAPRRAESASTPRDGDEVVRVGKRARAPRVVEITVRDRRRRTPVEKARIKVSRPSATSVEPLGDGTTDAAGRFRVALPSAVRAGDQLLVTHRGYLPIAIELPRAAEVELAMTRRRDAVLDALITWARGAIRKVPPQPTPSDISVAAERELPAPIGDAAKTWSRAVERAAFGLDEIDERGQRKIEALEEAATSVSRRPPEPPPAVPGVPPADTRGNTRLNGGPDAGSL